MSRAPTLDPPSAPRQAPREPSPTYRARQVHRYLGLFIGIQFVLWTVGGLYFSWTSLDAVHGDHLMHPRPLVAADAELASPSAAVAAIRSVEQVDSLVGIGLFDLFGRPTYRIDFTAPEGDGSARRTRLADAATGAPRGALTREEAVRMATATFTGDAPVARVEYLTGEEIGGHHEYRGQPLPAWAITFDHPEGATAYVAAEQAQVIRIRTERWRVFDFLWMLHTMDYAGRDDFNNLLLRAFSVLGLLTVFSGFALFALTSPRIRRWIPGVANRRDPQRRG